MPFNSDSGPEWDRSPDSADGAEDDTEPLEPPYDADRGCPKCGCPETRVAEMRAEGGTASAMLDINSNIFRVVSCLGCGYSELYRDQRGHGSQDIVETFLE